MFPEQQEHRFDAISTALEAAPATTATDAMDEHLRSTYQNSQPEGKASIRDYLVCDGLGY